MYIVFAERGQYSNYRLVNICACHNEQDAKLAVSLLEEMENYMIAESDKFQQARIEFEKTIGIKSTPKYPDRNVLDPKFLLSNADWQIQYVQPYRQELLEIQRHNNELISQVVDFKNAYSKQAINNLPEKFLPFKDYFGICDFGYYGDDTFSYEEVFIFGGKYA